jgi:Flp pilus assembly protein TadD
LAQFTFQNNTLIEEIGLPAANEALRINETDPILLDLVGFGHYLLGDLDTAESFFQQAAGLSPDNPQYWFHLGLVSLARGENLPAREYLDRAINLDTASPVAEEAKRVLARYFP